MGLTILKIYFIECQQRARGQGKVMKKDKSIFIVHVLLRKMKAYLIGNNAAITRRIIMIKRLANRKNRMIHTGVRGGKECDVRGDNKNIAF
jgi:hypothetical protein